MRVPRGDQRLIQIVDASMAEAVRRGGNRVKCRLGCTECCEGPFEINALDAARLRRGFRALQRRNPEAAGQIQERARRFEGRDDESCPVLDPATGGCLLYEDRPMICRTFGPAVRTGGNAIAICHRNYRGAPELQISECAVTLDLENLEARLLDEVSGQDRDGATTVAKELTSPSLSC